jgi:hypothetical protein
MCGRHLEAAGFRVVLHYHGRQRRILDLSTMIDVKGCGSQKLGSHANASRPARQVGFPLSVLLYSEGSAAGCPSAYTTSIAMTERVYKPISRSSLAIFAHPKQTRQ